MDKLSKSQHDEYAVAFAILALYDGGADISADQIQTLLTATGNTDVEAFYPLIYANCLMSSPDRLAQLIAYPASSGGSGGDGGDRAAADGSAGAAGAAAEAEKPEEKEEEEMDLGGGMDMFGGEEGGGGGGGDY